MRVALVLALVVPASSAAQQALAIGHARPNSAAPAPRTDYPLGPLPSSLSFDVDYCLTLDGGMCFVEPWLGPEYPAGATVTYQWYRDGKAIPTQTDQYFRISAPDVGHHIRVKVTVSADGYEPVSVWNQDRLIPKIVSQVDVPSFSIEGTTYVGDTLHLIQSRAFDEGWVQIDWCRNGVAVDSSNNMDYVLSTADLGKRITAKVTLWRTFFKPKVVIVNSSKVTLRDFTATPEPSVLGTQRLGETISADIGDWDPNANLTFQWYSNQTPIDGATSKDLVIPEGIGGTRLSFVVTAQAYGYITVVKKWRSASLVGFKLLPPLHVDFDYCMPVVNGLCYVIPWMGPEYPAGTVVSYQWFRDGILIPRMTYPEYNIGANDSGHHIRVKVTFSAEGYEPRSIWAQDHYVPPTVIQTNVPTFTVEGVAKVGNTLHLVQSRPFDEGWMTIEWYRNGQLASSSGTTDYLLTVNDIGKRITAKITLYGQYLVPRTVTSDSSHLVVPAGIK
jgi:hypothetical protein